MFFAFCCTIGWVQCNKNFNHLKRRYTVACLFLNSLCGSLSNESWNDFKALYLSLNTKSKCSWGFFNSRICQLKPISIFYKKKCYIVFNVDRLPQRVGLKQGYYLYILVLQSVRIRSIYIWNIWGQRFQTYWSMEVVQVHNVFKHCVPAYKHWLDLCTTRKRIMYLYWQMT